MSLVFLAADYPPQKGGIQTVAHELPLALHRAGHEVGVVALCQPGAEEFDAACPYPTVRVPGGGKHQLPSNLVAGANELIPQFSARPEAIVATKWFPDGLAARWVSGYPRVPIVVICHGDEAVIHGGNPVKWLLQRSVLGRASTLVAVSRWTADQVARAKVPRERIRVVGNGIRPETFATAEGAPALRQKLGLGEEPVLLTTGRLVARKGHADVLRLLPKVIEQLGPVTYLIVGDGPEMGALRGQVKALGLEGAVQFAGSVPDEDMAAYYRLCDAFAMPTKAVPGAPKEGFGIVYLEANAAGKPVIATDCGGVADAVEDGVSGLLLPEADDTALVAAMVRLLGDRAFAQALGASAAKRVGDRFTWDQVAIRFLEAIG